MKTKLFLIAFFALICTVQGAWADVTVTAESDLRTTVQSNNTVTADYKYIDHTWDHSTKKLTAEEPTSQQAGVRAFVMNFGKDEATGIIAVENEILPIGNNTDAWYTIDGRKFKGMPTQRGVYINSGKKIMIK